MIDRLEQWRTSITTRNDILSLDLNELMVLQIAQYLVLKQLKVLVAIKLIPVHLSRFVGHIMSLENKPAQS